MTKIKICGLKRPEDIETVNAFRPDYAGFIVDYPKSHRSVSIERLRYLSSGLDDGIAKVGVFVDYDPSVIIELLQSGIIDIAQLHGRESEETIRAVKEAGKPVIKSFHADQLEAALVTSADFPLFDNIVPGSGKSYDVTPLVGFKRPFFLAGGVSELNAVSLIAMLRPYALDASSSVETDKLKDSEKVRRLISIVRSANGNR